MVSELKYMEIHEEKKLKRVAVTEKFNSNNS